MPEEELQNILAVSLVDEEVEECPQLGCSRENESESSYESDTSETGGLETLRREVAATTEESIRGHKRTRTGYYVAKKGEYQ